MPNRLLPPLLVALAAMLWWGDLLLRERVVRAGWSAADIVLTEHLLLTLALAVPLWRGRALLARLSRREWGLLAFVGVGGSALATWMYTEAFTLDPLRALTVVLLQKTQPIFALVLAGWALRERRAGTFWAWCALALTGALLLIVADSGFRWERLPRVRAEQALLALSASGLWGAATVAGRPLSVRLPPALLSGARFALALPVLALFALFGPPPPLAARTPEILGTVALIALAPGLLGMSLYYYGLRGTSASAATLAELCYPLTSLLIGVAVLHTPMTPGLWAGLALLVLAVVGLGRRPGVAVARGEPQTLSAAVP